MRTCDGYFFPLIKSAQQTKQASCEYACPSAPVAYYHGASIDTARNLSGEKYSSLPTAFKFREKVSPGCTCHPPEESQQHSLKIVKNDPTAHSGDIVVEQRGAFVYNGKQAVPIDRSRQVSASVRQNIYKMTAGPIPGGAVDQSALNTPDGSPTSGSSSSGLLTGAARPMGELDAAAVNSATDDFAFLRATPWLLAIALLSGCALAALRLSPGLRDRLRAAYGSVPTEPASSNLVEIAGAVSVNPSAAPLAWVWSAYQGVMQPIAEASGPQPSSIASTASDPAPAIGDLAVASTTAGDPDRPTAQVNPTLLLMSTLSERAQATWRKLSDLRDRLASFLRPGATRSTPNDPVDGAGGGPDALAPTSMAWVWSEYRGVVQKIVEDSTQEASTSAPLPSPGATAVDMLKGEIASFAPTSIAWVWSEYRGAV